MTKWQGNITQQQYNVSDAILDAETERYLTEVEQEGITKEQDEEIMKIKQRQVREWDKKQENTFSLNPSQQILLNP